MAARFPAEPFSPERLPDAAEPTPGVDPVFPVVYRAAVSGAEAYRATRTALRREGRILRVGNRFVPIDRYREIGFAALGSAALSLALAVTAALGEHVTQGLGAGPDPLPREVPFRSRTVKTDLPGRVDPAAGEEVLELARGLGEKDLFLLLLSAGSLGFLAAPPAGSSAADWERLLADTGRAGASSREVAKVARVLGLGGVGGRVAASTRADTVALVVDRGDGADLVGGGPTLPVRPSERVEVRAILARTGLTSRLPTPSQAALSPGAEGPPAGVATLPSSRPVALVTPADALREVGEAVQPKRWRPSLAELSLPGGPEAAADRLIERTDELLRASPLTATAPSGRASRGLVALAGTTLGVPEGVDERPAMARFIDRAAGRLPWRSASVGLLRTAGGRPGEGSPGLVRSARASGASAEGPAARTLAMRSGITDVGLVAVVVVPLP